MMRRVLSPLAMLSAVASLLSSVAPAAAQEPSPASNAAACIAIMLPSVKGASGDATTFATAVRDRFVSFLTGPSLRAIALDARLASQAIEEARQKQCGQILVTSLELKRHDGSGWGRALGRAAGGAAWYGVPYGGSVAGAAARGAAIAGAQAIAGMAETTRAKDEVTLEYRFGSLDTAGRATSKVEKLKAQRDGEDLLTPLVEKASEAVAATALKK